MFKSLTETQKTEAFDGFAVFDGQISAAEWPSEKGYLVFFLSQHGVIFIITEMVSLMH